LTHTNEPRPTQETKQQQHPPSVSKKLTLLFNNLFKSAESKQNTELNQEKPKTTKPHQKEPQPSPNKRDHTLNPTEKSFTLDTNELANFFPELGIQSLAQIEHFIINVTSHIQTASNTPNIPQQFIMQLKQFTDSSLQITISSENNAKNILLNCKGELHQILCQYLPELKKHLRKKSIDFDEILLNPTESPSKSNTSTPNPKKNNLPRQ
jgi:hypothetical protein